MSPHGVKGPSKKNKSMPMAINGPKISGKKKRKLQNENSSDLEVAGRVPKYWRGLKVETTNDLKEKIMKQLSCPSHRYKVKDNDIILPAKKKRKLQKNGSIETDSEEDKTVNKKGRIVLKKKQQYMDTPTSKLYRWKKLGVDRELSAVMKKTKKLGTSDSPGKGKKKRQKFIAANYEDMDGVCIYDLDTPEMKSKAKKKKLIERQKGSNHIVNKKKVRIGKCVVTLGNLGKKQKMKPKVDVGSANFKLLPKKQQKKLQEKYSLQLYSDPDVSDSDVSLDGRSAACYKKNKTKLAKDKWTYQQLLNKKKAKLKKEQELGGSKSKKSSKRQQVSEDDDSYENNDDDSSSDEEDISDEDVIDGDDDLEEEEDEEEDLDEDDDEEDDSEDQTSDEQLIMADRKSSVSQGLSKHVWTTRYEDKALVILKHPLECNLTGFTEVCVLSGCINILGAKLTANGHWHQMYSPYNHTLLKMTTEYPCGKEGLASIKKKVASMLSDTDCHIDFIDASAVVLLIRHLNWGFSDYISTIRPYQRLFQGLQDAEKLPYNQLLEPFGIGLVARSEMPSYVLSSETEKFIATWETLLRNKDSPRVLLCGAKNTGKSTMCRTLMNISLNMKKAVCFLDCDPGQTEFTPPGCISLSLIQNYVLGPPFCHQQEPVCNIFFGEVSPDSNSNLYMMCVRSAINYYFRMPEPLPLVVNTMGWIKGPGKKMLDGILNLVPLDHVVLLTSPKVKFNPQDLELNVVKQNHWNFPGEKYESAITTCNWELTIFRSVVNPEIEKVTKLTGAELRNLSMLSYFGKNWSPGLSLNGCVPYTIKWSSVAIQVCHEVVPFSQMMYAINATVVALCFANLNEAYRYNSDENFPLAFFKRPICRCLGFGFVRGIDVESQMLYIVSPVPLKTITQVNTLLRGPIHLPLERMQDQDMTDLLYVNKTLVTSTGSQTLKRRQCIPRHR